MSDGPYLSEEAISFLLELLEQNEPLLSAGSAKMKAEATAILDAAGLLVPYDHELIVVSPDDHADMPVSVTWSERHGALTYFSPSAGIVVVPTEDVQRRRVDIGQVIAAISAGWDVPENRPPFALIDDVLWEITDVRLGGRGARSPVWFVRRVWDRDVRLQVSERMQARPLQTQRLILTSSRGERIADVEIPGAMIVPIRDVLVRPNDLAVSGEMLSARLHGVPAPEVIGPIFLSVDGTQLRIHGGPVIPFKKGQQMEAIRLLVAAYRHQKRVPIGDLSTHHSLSRLFGAKKWTLLKPYVKSVNGHWGFEP